jgi:hypothetical protein
MDTQFTISESEHEALHESDNKLENRIRPGATTRVPTNFKRLLSRMIEALVWRREQRWEQHRHLMQTF